MPLPTFEYLSPRSLAEACAMLAARGTRARPMAGGTDLLLRMDRDDGAPRVVVGLRNVPDLAYVRFDPASGLRIGALALLSTVAESADVEEHYPALARAAAATATVQIRNMGTVAGNLCNASPAADTATPLLVHEAEVVLVRPAPDDAGAPLVERTLALQSFFLAPGRTALDGAELLREVRVPLPPARGGSSYQRISQRSAVDIAAVCVAAHVTVDEEGRCARARIALGAVASVPLRAEEAERAVTGAPLDAARVARAAALAARASRPITDTRASADWRRKMVEVLTARALRDAAARAGRREGAR